MKAPTRVKTLVVSSDVVDNAQTYVGMVEEREATAVSFTGMGVVKRVLVREGQAVGKGQLLEWAWGILIGSLAHTLLAGLLLFALLAPLLKVLATVLLDLSQDGLLIKAEQRAALLGIHHAGNLVRDEGDGLDHIGNGGCALDGVVLGVLQYYV